MLVFVDKREQMRIFVSADAKKVVEDFARQFDMKEQGVASRIYSWFGTLPLPVQKWITGLTDGDEGKGMQAFAEMLVGQQEKKPGKKYRSIFPTEQASHPQPDDPPHEPHDKTRSGPGSRSAK